MAVLLDLLHPYPVLETLASVMGAGDLFNLSKVSSTYRAALHGFLDISLVERDAVDLSTVRLTLLVGQHQTTCWEKLKARSRLRCSEPQHSKGTDPKVCILCSMPVW